MLISVLYVGKDAPDDWIPINRHARMAVLSFPDFINFIRSCSGKVYATPEVEDYDCGVWRKAARQYQNRRIRFMFTASNIYGIED